MLNGMANVSMDDHFLYFGYGSSLNLALLEFRVNEPVIFFEKGTLKNHALRFNRRNPDGTARANLIEHPTEDTLGVLYQISIKHFELLSQTEPCYELKEIEVQTENELKKAHTFICNHITEGIRPNEKYLTTILEGAMLHFFPQDYIEHIRNVAGI